MKLIIRECGALAVVLCCVNISFALQISEIQFDPSGSDTGREWVEVFNDANSSIDLTQYKFYEENTNHGIDVLSGDKTLASGEYAVLVQDMGKFKIDFPNYTGKIFKSSFSLSNSGEALALKDKNSSIVFSVDYSSSASTAGNGLTLNYNGSSFVKGSPTPGTGNLSVNPNISGDSSTNSEATTTSATSTPATSTTATTTIDADGNFIPPIYYHRSYFPEAEKIYLNPGENKIGLTGADILFEVSAVMGNDRSPVNANYFWSFGDGTVAEGAKVYHSYAYPGEYTVDVEAYANGSKNDTQIYVKAVNPEISVSLDSKNSHKVVLIKNNSRDQIDVGGFQIQTSGGEFEHISTLPRHLSILPKKEIILAQETLHFATSTGKVALLYQNGEKITSFEYPKPITSMTTQGKEPHLGVAVGSTTEFFGAMTKEEFTRKIATSSVSIKKVATIIKKPKPDSLNYKSATTAEVALENNFKIENNTSLWENMLNLFHK